MTLTLDDKYIVTEGSIYLTGIQALVRLPLDQQRRDAREGLRTGAFITGYEGSPLAGYDLTLARTGQLLKAHNIVHQPAVNEELGATAAAIFLNMPTLAAPDPRVPPSFWAETTITAKAPPCHTRAILPT
jgi:hypothetical protein